MWWSARKGGQLTLVRVACDDRQCCERLALPHRLLALQTTWVAYHALHGANSLTHTTEQLGTNELLGISEVKLRREYSTTKHTLEQATAPNGSITDR